MRLSRRPTRHLICLASLLAFVSTPLLAQTGIDLLDADQIRRAIESPGGPERTVTVRAMLDQGPDSVIQATHVRDRLRYDDGEFENFAQGGFSQLNLGSGRVEVAQRFVVSADSAVVSAQVCFKRRADDPNRAADFLLHFYADEDDDGVKNPGRRRGLTYVVKEDITTAGAVRCMLLRGHLVGKPLDKGVHWVAVDWDTQLRKSLGEDHYTSDDEAVFNDRTKQVDHATEVRYRQVPPEPEAQYEGWLDPRSGDRTQTASGLKAVGIRLLVERTHAAEPDPTPDPTPDPEPDPEPEDDVRPGPLTAPPPGAGYSNCIPTVSRLVFDGDYRVSLCYETADGTKGEARAGIYKSSQSGLLWFFDSNNAEVLIKVLDGCMTNGHRWAFMAAATDVAFNLYVTDGKNQTWSYHNQQGQKALTQTDNMALRCSP